MNLCRPCWKDVEMAGINKKIHDPERKNYWNEEYVIYWKKRVDEANDKREGRSAIVKDDVKSSSDSLYANAISLLNIDKNDKVMELGCGFGRSLPLLCELAGKVAAVDISKEMIRYAQEFCRNKNVGFYVSPGEDLPFPDESFDAIVCFASFDAMYQAETLMEINRIGKVGARVLITGKNDNYHRDDNEALVAEKAAREKKHPNYFTNTEKLIGNLDYFGFMLDTQRYFLRRGDFMKGISAGETVKPDRFYEYLFVLKKTKAISGVRNPVSISSSVSRVCAGES
jgi:ubiquinone/menaquinone biosynthesis C-methylase UbiE